jgi:hypothetical protein
MIAILNRLTAGQFNGGAIVRILLNEFWRQGVAIPNQV